MKSNVDSARKAFLERLTNAKIQPISIGSSLWASRSAFLQWLLSVGVAAVLVAQIFGSSYAYIALALGLGLILGFFLQVREATKTLPWLLQAIDWDKVEQQLAKLSREVA
jgi:hypothetical protein